MAKYDALKDELFRNGAAKVTLTFPQIEKLVGPLPPSAHSHEWWWANEDHHTSRHVQCKAWGDAGYAADVNLAHQSVTFTRN